MRANMNNERLRFIGHGVRRGSLLVLPLAATLSGCAGQHSETVTIDIPRTSTPAPESTETSLSMGEIIEQARTEGQGIVIITMEKSRSSNNSNVILKLNRIDGPSPANTHLDKQSGEIAAGSVPINATAISWFKTATCGGKYQVAFSLDEGQTYRALLVPNKDGDGIPQPTFELTDCVRGISITSAINAKSHPGD